MSRSTVLIVKILFLAFALFSPMGRAIFYFAFVQRPAYALVGTLAVWVIARLLGAAQTLGYEALRELDALVTGGLTVTIGCYALLCRGVGLSGIVATALLSGAFWIAIVRRYGRPGAFSLAVTAFAWLAVLYRFFRPV